MNPNPDVVQPDEVWERDGETIALFGQGPCVPYDQPIDPIPSVYASYGEIEPGGDYRMSLDEAERYAERILNAVRWQRAQLAEKRAAELNAMATGAAATHDWHQPDRSAECRRCRTVVRAGDELLVAGVVPACGNRCPMGWHEIGTALPSEEGDAVCMFCKASWSAEHLYVLKDRQWRSLAVGPFLTFDQASTISQVDSTFVPIKLPRDQAVAAVADAASERLAEEVCGG